MKTNRISAAQIQNAGPDEQQVNSSSIRGKVKTILVRNNNASAENMWVGFNGEDASDKVTIEPGEFMALSKDDGSFYDGTNITFVFAASNSTNKGYLITETELETKDC